MFKLFWDNIYTNRDKLYLQKYSSLFVMGDFTLHKITQKHKKKYSA